MLEVCSLFHKMVFGGLSSLFLTWTAALGKNSNDRQLSKKKHTCCGIILYVQEDGESFEHYF